MSAPTVAAPAPSGAWPMYRAMVGVGLVCGLLIVGVFEWTRPIIERNKAEALQRAILQVLPAAATSGSFRFTAEDRFERAEPPLPGEPVVHAGFDAAGNLIGLAVEAEGMGYQDVIHVIWGYSFEQDAIIGIRVLESKETPGLGDKIESDPDFLANFRRLDVRLDAAGTALAHPIRTVKHGAKTEDWQVDGITGATISSVAIGNLLDRSASEWVPRIRARLADFREEIAP